MLKVAHAICRFDLRIRVTDVTESYDYHSVNLDLHVPSDVKRRLLKRRGEGDMNWSMGKWNIGTAGIITMGWDSFTNKEGCV